jgi:hypothetical protein
MPYEARLSNKIRVHIYENAYLGGNFKRLLVWWHAEHVAKA